MNNIINVPKIALMFPGQGSQYEKMGQQFLRFNSSSNEYFEIAGEITGKDLAKIINGQDPDSSLGDTRFSQISIYALSCALFDYLSENLSLDINSIDTVVGHSLGEYSALYSCGAYDFRAGAELVVYRGNIMSNADRSAKGMMAAILGAEAGRVEDVLKEYRDRVFIANYNDYTQIVISGYKEDVKNAMAGLKEKGIKKVIPLKVNIASHCPLMGEVSKKLGDFIDKNIIFKEPILPFLSTTEAKYTGKSELKKTLTGQLTNPIHWVDSIKLLLDKGVNTFIEIGPGKVLSGLVLRIARKNKKNVDIMNTNDIGDIEDLIGKLQKRGLLK